MRSTLRPHPGGWLVLGLLASCPEPPPAPDKNPCAPGFIAVEDGRACDAVLPDADCPAGTMPRLGHASCVPVGTHSCPRGMQADVEGWGCQDILPQAPCSGASIETLGQATCQPLGDCAAALPADASLFVDASYTPDQLDATHVASLAQALAQASAGAIIAVEAGTYVETLRLQRGATVVGRCPALVTLQAPVASGTTGVEVVAGEVELRGLTLRGHFNGAIVRAGASLHLQQVVVEANAICGLRTAGGSLALRETVVRDGVADASGRWGYGILVEQGGRLDMVDSAAVHNRQAAIVVEDSGSSALLDGVVVTDTQPAGDGAFGIGLVVSGGPVVEVRRSVIARNRESGLYADSQFATQPTTLTLHDSVLRDTLPRAVGVSLPGGYIEHFGRNLMVQGYAAVDVHNSSIRRASGAAVVAAKAATVRLHDSVVFDTTEFPNGDSTSCAAVQEGGSLELVRTALGRGAGTGVMLYHAGSRLSLVDALITDIRRSGQARNGTGLMQSSQAEASFMGSAITGCDGMAVLTARSTLDALPAGSLRLERSVIADGRGYLDGSFGRGLDLGGGVTAELLNSALVRNREVALVVREAGTQVRLQDSVVRDTRPDGGGRFGRGINVQRGGAVELERCLLARNRDVQLLAGQVDSRAWLAHCTLLDALPAQVDGRFGWGAAAVEGAQLLLDDVRVARSGSLGLVYAAAGGTLAGSAVLDNPVGLQVQDGSTLREVAALPQQRDPLDVVVTRDTVFERNGTRLGSGAVPLPELLPPE